MRAVVLAIVGVSSTAVAAPRLASQYAPMFEKGHTWTYDLSLTEFDYVEKPGGTMQAVEAKPQLSQFTCTVTTVVSFDEAVVSTIHCDKVIDSAYGFRVDGMWIATKQGVFRGAGDEGSLPSSAREARELATSAVLIGPRPRPARARTKDGYGGFRVHAVTSPAKGTWCTTTDTTNSGAGDGAVETMCFRAGVGISRGLFDYHGGTPRIVEYTIAK